MTIWLMEREAWRALQGARKTAAFSADQLTAHIERAEAAMDGAPRNLRIAGSTAQIDVAGVLTKKPDIFAHFFGGGNTTYSAIQAALAFADASPEVKDIVLAIDSPGGQVDGLFETIAAIQATKKPLRVVANLAASAAYALAAAAGKIEASSPSATFGSIGVVATYFLEEDVVEVTSSAAPNKRPDVSTDEGKAVVRAYLDELHELFVEAIATGRGIAAKDVNSGFGGGSVFAAGESKRRGMIDGIKRPQLRAVGPETPPTAEQQENNTMDLKTFKAQHPEHVEALCKEGAASERDRVVAHLTMGEASGDMKTAIEAITSGEPMTATLQAKYLSAGMNRRDQNARAADDKVVEAATAGADQKTETKDLGDQLAEAMLGTSAKETK
jgi:capsid assembly protease